MYRYWIFLVPLYQTDITFFALMVHVYQIALIAHVSQIMHC
jgi:hypothetical protein